MIRIARVYQWCFGYPFDLMVCVTMIAIGIAVIIWPDIGISGYIQNVFKIPMVVYGGMLIVCGLEVIYHPSTLRFAIFTAPLMLFTIMSIPYFVDGILHGNTTISVTTVIIWGSYYRLLNWVNSRRSQLIVVSKHDEPTRRSI